MITIRVVPLATTPEHRDDFYRSLRAHASTIEGFQTIEAEDTPAAESRVTISLPDNVLILGRDWDKYVRYWLDHDLPIDFEFVKKRFAPQSRTGEAEFQCITVEYPVVTT